MSGSRPTPVEQHLGDRLAALVDGELGHESRERVLSHLATCTKCRAEADAQRRLKSVFAQAAPPPPSESFLARLQGLPGGDGDSGRGFGNGVFGMAPDAFGYTPPESHRGSGRQEREGSILPDGPAWRGFRIHDVGRQEAERSASRGRRFAFAAAGAVSLAAFALGGVSTGMPVDTGEPRGSSAGKSNVTPVRTQSAGNNTSTQESSRRRAGSPALSGQQAGAQSAPVDQVSESGPLLPGPPLRPLLAQAPPHPFSAPLLLGNNAASPLIPPVSSAPSSPAVSSPNTTVPSRGGSELAAAPGPSATPSSGISSAR